MVHSQILPLTATKICPALKLTHSTPSKIFPGENSIPLGKHEVTNTPHLSCVNAKHEACYLSTSSFM